MRQSSRLGNGLNLVYSSRLKFAGESPDRLRCRLGRDCDIEQTRGAMTAMGFGSVDRMSDEAILDELTRMIGTGRYALKDGAPKAAEPGKGGGGPKPRPLPIPDPSALDNPFEYLKGENWWVREWGIIIGGSNFAAKHFDRVVAGHRAEVDPKADPEKERLRLLREDRERVAARLQGIALIREYQRDVKTQLLQIRSSATGLALMNEIQRQAARADILISPYHLDEEEGETRGGSASDRPLRGVRERLFGPKPAQVNFTPEHWRRKYLLYSLIINGRWGIYDEWGPGTQPDEVLLHELVHAFFIVTGKDLRRRVPFQGKRYKTESWHEEHEKWRGPYEMDEFMAIMIANIYRSEKGRDKIRHSHTDFKPHDLTAEEFLKIGLNRAHIRLLRRKQPRLFNALNDVEAPWNPIREFRDSPLGGE